MQELLKKRLANYSAYSHTWIEPKGNGKEAQGEAPERMAQGKDFAGKIEVRDYTELQGLIESYRSLVSFGAFGEGISESEVERAEDAIGHRLPASYRWWLRNYGGGEVGGEEIFSVYGPGFEGLASGDIVAMYRNSGLTTNAIPICNSDIDGLFYFDVDAPAGRDEYVVMSAALERKYADDFAEFLKKRIEAFAR